MLWTMRGEWPQARFLELKSLDKHAMWTQNVHMRTASVRDLRNNFAMLEAWLNNGESVRIEKRGEPIAILSAIRSGKAKQKLTCPDFASRRKAIWGDRVFSEDEVQESRHFELDGEEG